jgi:hypothetical protein
VFELGDKYDELVNLQQDPKKRANARGVDDVLNSTLRSVFGTAEAPSGEKATAQKFEKFRRAFYTKVQEMEKVLGQQLDGDQLQKAADAIMMEVPNSATSFWRDDRSYYELTPEEQAEYDRSKVPTTEQQQVMGVY